MHGEAFLFNAGCARGAARGGDGAMLPRPRGRRVSECFGGMVVLLLL